jgi:hypothetical protein
VHRSSVVASAPTAATLRVDVSVLEEPANDFTRRIQDTEFIAAKGHTAPPFYVSAIQPIRSFQATCSSPFAACATFIPPGQYSLRLLDYPRAEPMLRRLYDAGRIKLWYEVAAPRHITAIRTRLVLGQVLVDNAGCYPDRYRGTQVTLLLDSTFVVNSRRLTGIRSLPVARLTSDTSRGEVQYNNLMLLVIVHYRNGAPETLLRRVTLPGGHQCL